MEHLTKVKWFAIFIWWNVIIIKLNNWNITQEPTLIFKEMQTPEENGRHLYTCKIMSIKCWKSSLILADLHQVLYWVLITLPCSAMQILYKPVGIAMRSSARCQMFSSMWNVPETHRFHSEFWSLLKRPRAKLISAQRCADRCPVCICASKQCRSTGNAKFP